MLQVVPPRLKETRTHFKLYLQGNAAVAALLLQSDAGLLDINDALSNTPLHAAAYAGSSDTVTLLLRVRHRAGVVGLAVLIFAQ